MRSRARAGTMWTKPSRSWLESRNPMPRPIPDSKYDADRDMLNVIMHWYAFQMLTIRLVCSSGVATWRMPSVRSQYAHRSANAASAAVASRYLAMIGLDGPLVDRLRAGRVELGVRRVFVIPQQEDDLPALAGLERQLDVVRADRLPAVRDRVERRAARHGRGVVPAAVRPQERVALRIEAGQRLGAGEVGEVIAALAVLGLVVDHARGRVDLDLAGAEVALEVGRIVLRVPQAELDGGEDRELRRLGAVVGHGELPDLQILAERDEVAGAGFDAAVGRADDRVAHPVPAGVVVQRAAGRLPRRRPEIAGRVIGRVVAQIDVAPAGVERRVVVAIAGQPAQAGIPVEGVAAGGVRDEPEIGLAAQVVDPRQGGVGAGDDVLAVRVIEETVLHVFSRWVS